VFPEDEGSLWHSFRVLDDVPPRLQAIFYSARASADMKELCQGLSPVDLARLTSAKHRLSGLAFRADIPDPRCQMSDQDFRLAIRFRLGLHLSREAARGTCPFCKDKVSKKWQTSPVIRSTASPSAPSISEPDTTGLSTS
jgi:hypothetical protein